MESKIDKTVREIAIEDPRAVPVFESLGIDYCCGGRRPLKEACELANVPLEKALELLAAADEKPPEASANWPESSLRQLTRHIVEQHHSYIRDESPRLTSLLKKTVDRHAGAHPELKSIQDLFSALVEELFLHMIKEENVLFRYLVKMEEAVSEGRSAPAAMFGTLDNPISHMLADHDGSGELTARIRALSGNFQPPEDACPTYRALYFGLEAFERDLHQHIHLENNILFPRALEMERKESAYVLG